jgi:hypothetical protein
MNNIGIITKRLQQQENIERTKAEKARRKKILQSKNLHIDIATPKRQPK